METRIKSLYFLFYINKVKLNIDKNVYLNKMFQVLSVGKITVNNKYNILNNCKVLERSVYQGRPTCRPVGHI